MSRGSGHSTPTAPTGTPEGPVHNDCQKTPVINALNPFIASAERQGFGLLLVGTKADDSNFVIVTNPGADPGSPVSLDGVQYSVARASQGLRPIMKLGDAPLPPLSRYHTSQTESSTDSGGTWSTPSDMSGELGLTTQRLHKMQGYVGGKATVNNFVPDFATSVFPWKQNFSWDMKNGNILFCEKPFPLSPASDDILSIKPFTLAPSDHTVVPREPETETSPRHKIDPTMLPNFIRGLKDELIAGLDASFNGEYYPTMAAKRKRGPQPQANSGETGTQQSESSTDAHTPALSDINGSKRLKPSGGDEGDEDDDGDDDQNNRKPPKKKLPLDKVALGESRYLACPFLKWKPEHFIHRCVLRFKTINHLKGHLRDHHCQEYCPDCFRTFEDDNGEKSLDSHKAWCDKKRQQPVVVTKEVQVELKNLRFTKSSGINREDQWRLIYRLLFQVPNEQYCPDPFYDTMPSHYMAQLEWFVAQDGLQVFDKIVSQKQAEGLFPMLQIDQRRLVFQAVQEWLGCMQTSIREGVYSDIGPLPAEYDSNSFGFEMWPGALDRNGDAKHNTVRPEELLVDALHNQIASHNDTTEASSHLGSNGTAVTMANRHTDPPTQDLTTGLRELDGQFNHSLDCFLGWSNESPYTPGDRFTVEESVAADWRCYLASSGSSSLRSRSVESAA